MSDPRSFDHVAELYERVRPSYPPDAIAWLVEELSIDRESSVLDLGAGTGKLTRLLIPYAGRVVAVDRGTKMLEQLRRVVPQAEAIRGEAEAIPLPARSVDAVVCGQSFHWFGEEALAEIRRVLKPGGGLGLIWNVRDPDDELQQRVTALVAPFVPTGRPPVTASIDKLRDVRRRAFSFSQHLDADGVADRVGSISFVASGDENAREELSRTLRQLVEERGGRVAFRYRTEAFVTFAV